MLLPTPLYVALNLMQTLPSDGRSRLLRCNSCTQNLIPRWVWSTQVAEGEQ